MQEDIGKLSFFINNNYTKNILRVDFKFRIE